MGYGSNMLQVATLVSDFLLLPALCFGVYGLANLQMGVSMVVPYEVEPTTAVVSNGIGWGSLVLVWKLLVVGLVAP